MAAAVYRKIVNWSIGKNLYDVLLKHSKKTDVPMSRIVDRALRLYFEREGIEYEELKKDDNE